MKKKVLLGIFLALISVGILTSCGAEKEKEAVTTEAQATGGHMNIALYWFGETLDPALDWDGWTLTRAAVGETLVTVDENLQLVGQLADSWENVDETTWKFHIRQGVTFQNGNPLTPEAVKASIERTVKMNERGESALKLASIDVDGEYVVIKTKEPYGAFLANISDPMFIIVDTSVDTSKFKETPVCTGPYMVTSFKPATSFEVVAYENYWGGKPALDSVTVFNIEDDNTRALALQSGDVDMAQGIRAGDIALFTDNKDYIVKTTTGTRIEFLTMNTVKSVLKDKNLRLAVNSAVDYDTIAKVVGGGAVAARAPFPASAPYGYDELNKQTFDLEKAKTLLAEAGYKDTDNDGYVDKDGKNLELNIYGTAGGNTRANSTVAELLESQLKTAGIKANIKIAENLEDIKKNLEFDLLFQNWQTVSTGDSQWFLDNAFKTDGSGNYGKYSNKELDNLINKLATTFDVKERQKITKEASQLIIDEAYGTYIVSQANVNVSNNKVENMHNFPIDYYFLTADTKITK